MSSRTSYDRFGNSYNVTAIINDDLTLNVEKYEAYSPLFLSATFAISYGLSFASITATLAHTLLFYRKQIWVQSRRSMSEQPDIHARLMSKYPQVPDWWYVVILGTCDASSIRSQNSSHFRSSVSMFVFGVISIEVYKTDFPVWAFVLALIICKCIHHVVLRIQSCSSPLLLAFVYTVPIGIIQAITNNQIGLK